MNRSINIAITDSSRVGDARREAAGLAHQIGLREPAAGKLAILITEAAGNLHKHARKGCIILRSLEDQNVPGVEILSVDHGPGMPDVTKCMADGYSTAGSPGTGLGALSRLSDVFDIFSEPEKGTVMVSRVWNSASARRKPL